MGEYANLHASDMFHQEMEYIENIAQHHRDDDKNTLPIVGLPYQDIKRRTDKAVLILLDIEVKPFNTKSFPVNYMWLPLKHIRLNEKDKSVHIVQWLLERKIDEQCGIIAEREFRSWMKK